VILEQPPPKHIFLVVLESVPLEFMTEIDPVSLTLAQKPDVGRVPKKHERTEFRGAVNKATLFVRLKE